MAHSNKTTGPAGPELSRRALLKYGLAAGGTALLAASTTTAAASTTAAAPTTAAVAQTAPSSVLKVGIGQTADWLSPNMINRSPSFSVYDAMFEFLAWNDRQTGDVQPMLAKSWKVLDDNVTWELQLQQG